MSPATGGTLALVVRVSDVRGRSGDRFISPDEQIRDATQYAREHGYRVQVIEPHDLNVRFTWPVERRPGLSRALELIDAGRLAGLVVSSGDRLGPAAFCRDLSRRLREAGAALLVPDNPMIENLEARGFRRLAAEQGPNMNEAFREEIGLRWAKAARNAVERGVHPCRKTSVPTGYARNEEPPRTSGEERVAMTPEERWADPVVGQLVPSPHADAVREMFRLRRAGGSWTECCDLLDAAEVPNRSGGGWTHRAAARIVRNEVYKGCAFKGEIRNEAAHEPLVEPSLWDACQPAGPGVRTRGSEGALMAGLARCASCGRALVPSITDGRYRCRPKIIAGAEPCDAPASAPMAALDRLATGVFFLAHDRVFGGRYQRARQAPDLSAQEREATRARAAYENLLAAIEADDDAGADALELLRRKRARLEEAERALLEACEAAGLDDEAATLTRERFEAMPVAERRRWLRAWGVEATVTRAAERGQPLHERLEVAVTRPTADGWDEVAETGELERLLLA